MGNVSNSKSRPGNKPSLTRGAIAAAVIALMGIAGLLSATQSASAIATSIDLGTASSYSVLGGESVTNTGSTVLALNVGVSPGTSITGFPPGNVGGTMHAADAHALQAQSDLVIAYDAAAGQAPDNSVSGDLGGRTLVPGVYESATSMGLTGTLTLDAEGDPDAVFLFQMGSTLTTATSSSVELINGAQACNVFWQVGSSATLGTDTTFVGNILALTSITADTRATVDGRALARNGSVTLDTNTFTGGPCATQPTATATASPTVTATTSPTVTGTATTSPTVTGTATTSPTVTGTATTSPTVSGTATASAAPTGTSTTSPTGTRPGLPRAGW